MPTKVQPLEVKDEEVSRTMRDPIRSRHHGSEGFALILAILALMLLTTLGLALSVTTTTEMQIATNYRWSQQALYNAEAGLEVGKALLASSDWLAVLPAPRNNPWDPEAQGPNQPTEDKPIAMDPAALRNYENGQCDRRGHGAGYGVVLVAGGTTWEYISRYQGKRLPGAFTLWIRRPLEMAYDGSWHDWRVDDDTAILTAEGSAPYSGDAESLGGPFVQENRAVRIVEMVLTRRAKPCVGGGNTGAGVDEANSRKSACPPVAE